MHHSYSAPWITRALLAAAVGTVAMPAFAQSTAPSPDDLREAPRPSLPAAVSDNAQQPGGLMDRAANNGAQVYVDDSFASVEKIRAAARLASQGQSQQAITAYQNIIDTFGQKLVYLNDESYISITDYVRDKLLKMPAVQGGMYDQLLGIQAKREIDAAVEVRDLPTLIRECDRYFPSSAAFEGLSHAAQWYFERADFAAAARTWEQLLGHPRAGGKKAELLFRAAVAKSLNQDRAGAGILRDRLAKEFPDATGTVDGAEVPLLARLDDVFALPAWDRSQDIPKDQWPAFQGGPSRSSLLNVNASIDAQLWTADITDADAPPRPLRPIPMNNIMIQRRIRGLRGAANMGPRLNAYPVLFNNTLFIHTGDRILALSANAGTPLWSYPPENSNRNNSPGEQVYGAQDDNALRPAAHDSAAVLGDHVFAVLPAPSPRPTADDEVEDNELMPTTRVVSIDRNTGQERWSTGARDVKLDTKGALTFIGSPVVTRQGVFVMARKSGEAAFIQLYLVRLDVETGKPSWSCYICSASVGAYYGAVMGFATIPVPTLADDMVYISTGQGADCAIDANAGRIRWLQITDSAKKTKTPQEFYAQREVSPSWKFNPPLVHGDTLITYDPNGGQPVLHLYDRWTGKPLRTITSKSLHMSSFDVMAGIVDSTLVLTGSNVTAIPLDNLDQDATASWVTDFPSAGDTGRPLGRPFLASTRLYVPFEKGMLVVDPRTGKTLDFADWPRPQKQTANASQAGNFLVTSEQIVVVNDNEVAGYSKWETARDNRLAQIQRHPDDPAGYLALAEISFRTDHFDLAEENMKRAVELATAPGRAGDAAAELARLYRTNLSFAEQLLAAEETSRQARARFYYNGAKATARTPEQQAEWRLSLSSLALAEKKPEEAATLYNEVLNDPALRAAPYRSTDALARAGVTAEQRFRALLENHGPDLYKPFKDQADALLSTARAQNDPAKLQQVVDAYPNSPAAISAATELVDASRSRQDWLGELRILRWLYPHTSGDARARVTADLAIAHLSLKRFAGALAWSERGLRQYKDFSWTDPVTHTSTTFAALRDKLRAAGPSLADDRGPALPPPPMDADGHLHGAPAMDESSADSPLTTGVLLVPLEQSVALRRPDLLFVYRMRRVHIFNTATGEDISKGSIELPDNAPAALLGSYGDITVVAQARTIVGINTRTLSIAWKIPLDPAPREYEDANAPARRERLIRPGFGGRVIVRGNARVFINGNVISADDLDFTNASAALADPEVARQTAFARLGQPRFSSLRIINGKLIVLAGDSMLAYSVDSGAPLWKNADGSPAPVKITGGTPALLTGNEDLLLAQVDSPDRVSSSFFIVDAETGKFRKEIKLDGERALWRTLSDDGVLYAVTDQGVLAYDLFAETPGPLWRRSDIQSRFPYATVLSLDGLVLVNTKSEVTCLSLESGEVRWPTAGSEAIRLDIPETQGELPYLRSALDGDMVIYESTQGIAAYYTYPTPADEHQLAWRGSITPGQTPPLDSFQIADPYVAVLAMGVPAPNTPLADRLLLLNRKGGLLHFTRTLIHDAAPPTSEGPLIRQWLAVNNGIAFEVAGRIYFYHGKRPALAAPPGGPASN